MAASTLLITACSGCGGGAGAPGSSAAPRLKALTLSVGELSPAFSPDVHEYFVEGHELLGSDSVQVIPTGNSGASSILVDGLPVASGEPSSAIPLTVGVTPILLEARGAEGTEPALYTVFLAREFDLKLTDYGKASNADAEDVFGHSIDLDGNTLVVGALAERSHATGVNGNELDNSLPQAGAAYVYVRTEVGWLQQAYLKASNTEAGDTFGASVAISGDTIVVGAYGEDSGIGDDQLHNGVDGAGAAYVFVRQGEHWAQQAYLKASNPGVLDRFGSSVDIDGDMLVVGATGEASGHEGLGGDGSDNGAPWSGAAYVFTRTESTWTEQVYLKASNTNADDMFGHRVAVSGDTVAVSANGESSAGRGVDSDQWDNAATRSGAVYVYSHLEGSWVQEAYIKASNASAQHEFGFSIALDGETLAVGAPFEHSPSREINSGEFDAGGFLNGAAYVFIRQDEMWIQQAYLKASNSDEGDWYGVSLALHGDALIVGASGESSDTTDAAPDAAWDNLAPSSGAAYLLSRSGSTWSEELYLKASNTDTEDRFGGSVAISSQCTVVGASWEDGSAQTWNGDDSDDSSFKAGAIYAYE